MLLLIFLAMLATLIAATPIGVSTVPKRQTPGAIECFTSGVPISNQLLVDIYTTACQQWNGQVIPPYGGLTQNISMDPGYVILTIGVYGNNYWTISDNDCVGSFNQIMNNCSPNIEENNGGVLAYDPNFGEYIMDVNPDTHGPIFKREEEETTPASILDTRQSSDLQCFTGGTPMSMTDVVNTFDSTCYEWDQQIVPPFGSLTQTTQVDGGTIQLTVGFINDETTTMDVSICVGFFEQLLMNCGCCNDQVLGGVVTFNGGAGEFIMDINPSSHGPILKRDEISATASKLDARQWSQECFSGGTSMYLSGVETAIWNQCSTWSQQTIPAYGILNQVPNVNGGPLQLTIGNGNDYAISVDENDCIGNMTMLAEDCSYGMYTLGGIQGFPSGLGEYIVMPNPADAVLKRDGEPASPSPLDSREDTPSGIAGTFECFNGGTPLKESDVANACQSVCWQWAGQVVKPNGYLNQTLQVDGGELQLMVGISNAQAMTMDVGDCLGNFTQLLTNCGSNDEVVGGFFTFNYGLGVYTLEVNPAEIALRELDHKDTASTSTLNPRQATSLFCYNNGVPASRADILGEIDAFCSQFGDQTITSTSPAIVEYLIPEGTVTLAIDVLSQTQPHAVNTVACIAILTSVIDGCNPGSDEKQGGILTDFGDDVNYI